MSLLISLLSTSISGGATTGILDLEGTINIQDDFPDDPIRIGLTYYIGTDITYNPTGQSFKIGDLITWEGNFWIITSISNFLSDYITKIYQRNENLDVELRQELNVLNGGEDSVVEFLNSSLATMIKLNTNGDSFFKGGNIGFGQEFPKYQMHLYGGFSINDNIIHVKDISKDLPPPTTTGPDAGYYVLTENNNAVYDFGEQIVVSQYGIKLPSNNGCSIRRVNWIKTTPGAIIKLSAQSNHARTFYSFLCQNIDNEGTIFDISASGSGIGCPFKFEFSGVAPLNPSFHACKYPGKISGVKFLGKYISLLYTRESLVVENIASFSIGSFEKKFYPGTTNKVLITFTGTTNGPIAIEHSSPIIDSSSQYGFYFDPTTTFSSVVIDNNPLTLNGDATTENAFLKNFYKLDYNTQTANFTKGQTLTGGTSGATGIIFDDDDQGTSGSLKVKMTSTTLFAPVETITDGGGGSAQLITSSDISSNDQTTIGFKCTGNVFISDSTTNGYANALDQGGIATVLTQQNKAKRITSTFTTLYTERCSITSNGTFTYLGEEDIRFFVPLSIIGTVSTGVNIAINFYLARGNLYNTITAVADLGGGQVRFTTSLPHRYSNGDRIIIEGTTSYNNEHTISNVTTYTFDATYTYVASETGQHYKLLTFSKVPNDFTSTSRKQTMLITSNAIRIKQYDQLIACVERNDASVVNWTTENIHGLDFKI